MLREPGHARPFTGTLIRGLVGGKIFPGNVDPHIPFFEVGLYLFKLARPWMAFIGLPEIEPRSRISLVLPLGSMTNPINHTLLFEHKMTFTNSALQSYGDTDQLR
ncbi:unnamed protein product [Prorocentrum cordatum]|uniref:Uncharacterized protein n=1 Tax=Prorocentrum cordatum TaxID=2364126 RepID=A0ABN9WD20_9DINO|nr:unnamed protein product [Polarella glacialis]